MILSHDTSRPALLLLLLSGEPVEDLLKGDLAEGVLPDAKLGGMILVKAGRVGRAGTKAKGCLG